MNNIMHAFPQVPRDACISVTHSQCSTDRLIFARRWLKSEWLIYAAAVLWFIVYCKIQMNPVSVNTTHFCTIHTKRPELLAFVCLSESCLTKGIFCHHCRNQDHGSEDHEVLMVYQLAEEARNCAFSASDSPQEHARTIDEASKVCFASLNRLRMRVNKSISEAEQWVLTNFGLL